MHHQTLLGSWHGTAQDPESHGHRVPGAGDGWGSSPGALGESVPEPAAPWPGRPPRAGSGPRARAAGGEGRGGGSAGVSAGPHCAAGAEARLPGPWGSAQKAAAPCPRESAPAQALAPPRTNQQGPGTFISSGTLRSWHWQPHSTQCSPARAPWPCTVTWEPISPPAPPAHNTQLPELGARTAGPATGPMGGRCWCSCTELAAGCPEQEGSSSHPPTLTAACPSPQLSTSLLPGPAGPCLPLLHSPGTAQGGQAAKVPLSAHA